MKCINCEFFRDRQFFFRTGGTAGKCYNSSSRFFGQWRVGTDGCESTREVELDLFKNFENENN